MLKGRIRLGTIVLAGLRLLLCKELRTALEQLKKATKEVSYGKG